MSTNIFSGQSGLFIYLGEGKLPAEGGREHIEAREEHLLKNSWIKAFKCTYDRKKASGALPGLMRDLGLLEIILGKFFFLFLTLVGGSIRANKDNLYLT